MMEQLKASGMGGADFGGAGADEGAEAGGDEAGESSDDDGVSRRPLSLFFRARQGSEPLC